MSPLLSVEEKGEKPAALLSKERRSVIPKAMRSNPALLRQHILTRDRHTCHYCGFVADKFQQVATITGHSKYLEDYATLCIFCEQCVDLQLAASQSSGALAWIPEIEQADLNNLCRSIYAIKKAEDHPANEAVGKLLDQIMGRRTEAKKRIGTDDPLVLATVMLENLSDQEYAARGKRLAGIRLAPFAKRIVHRRTGEMDQFPDILDYWTSPEGPLRTARLDHWTGIYKELRKA